MEELHLILGIAILATSLGAAAWGGWCWQRNSPSAWFWRLLRTCQALVVAEAVVGGIELLTGREAPSDLHLLYGVLPVLVSFIAEQLRLSSASTILAAHGFESAREVGMLPERDQRGIVAAIVRRETGVMALSAIVIFGLAVRAATT